MFTALTQMSKVVPETWQFSQVCVEWRMDIRTANGLPTWKKLCD